MRLLFCCLLLFRATASQAFNPSDSLLVPAGKENLVYYGPLEKMVFTVPQGEEIADRVRLFLASSKDNAFAVADFAQNQLLATLRRVEGAKAVKKTKAKDLEPVHQALKSRYFRQYDPFSDFGSLFKAGHYNEYTAAALYLIVLDHLGYDYELKAGLETVELIIRTSDQPQSLGEILNFDPQKDKNPTADYLDIWQDLSLIPAGQSRQSLVQTWNQRYMIDGAEPINPFQLAGLLYYKRAAIDYADRQYLLATHTLDKARTLYPTPLYEPLQAACKLQLAANLPMDSDRLEPLFDLYEAFPTAAVQKELIKRFAFLTEQYIPQKGKADHLHSLYREFCRRMKNDPANLNLIREIYYVGQAEHYAATSNTPRVIEYMDTIYRFRPNDLQVQDILSRLLVRSLNKRRDFEDCLLILGQYKKQYPFLVSNPHFRDLELFYLSERIRHRFDADRLGEASLELENFEKLLAQSGPTPRGVLWITTAYASASYYYFRQKDYHNARLMIARGLTLAPDDAFLTHRSALLLNY